MKTVGHSRTNFNTMWAIEEYMKGRQVMADQAKGERREWAVKRDEEHEDDFIIIALVDGEWHGVIAEGLDREDAELICRLHNAALDINPSNPMAVADILPTIFNLLKRQIAYDDKYKGKLPFGTEARELVAALTKPAKEEGD